MRYREEDLRRGTADVVTSGAGDIYFRADSFRARSGKRKSGLGLGLGLGEAGGYRLQVGRWMRIEDWGLRIGGMGKAESGIRNSEKNLSELCASAVQRGFTAETQRRGGVAPAERGPTEVTIQNQKMGSKVEGGRGKREGGLGLGLGLGEAGGYRLQVGRCLSIS